MITVYGASDDLIEVEGDIREEFYAIDDASHVLSFSDGTVLSVEYDRQGNWRIRRLAEGRATYTLTEATGSDHDYSDVATLDGEPITWVTFGKRFERKKP